MGYTLYDLDMTDANNTSFAGISQAENSMRAPAVNNAFRALDGALARFIADGGGTVTTGGSANAQTVTLNQAIATTVPTGFFFTVKFGYTNTSTTVTLNVNSIGAKSVKVNFGGVLSDPIPGDMRAGAYGHFIYDGTYMVLLNAQQQARYAPGTLYGLTLSNNSSDPTNDIDIAVGSCRSSDDSANIDLLSALTKRLDASWAVGSGNGGLDTGTVGNNTYYIWLIKRPDTGVVDALFSLSSSSPTMPTNYTIERAIGVVVRSGGVNGAPFLFPAAATASNYGRIQFPASANTVASSNTLDDYKEGTWTPTDASGASLTFASASGIYTKIGRLVVATFRLSYPNTANSSSAQIGGLPFASTGFGAAIGTGSVYAGAASPNGILVPNVINSGSIFALANNSGASNPTNANLSSALVSGTVIYHTAD